MVSRIVCDTCRRLIDVRNVEIHPNATVLRDSLHYPKLIIHNRVHTMSDITYHVVHGEV